MSKLHNISNGTGQPAIKGQCTSIKAMYVFTCYFTACEIIIKQGFAEYK